MKLEQGLKVGDLAGILRGEVESLLPSISDDKDILQKLTGRSTKEFIIDAIDVYNKCLESSENNREMISIDRGYVDELKMREIPFYSLSLPEINY